jgi:SAM-dependent methyltransferase
MGLRPEDIDRSTPSPLVRRFGSKIVNAAVEKPILDAACGSGRNAIFLATLGGNVICVDMDLTKLQAQNLSLPLSRRLILRQLDFVKDAWPFGSCSLGGIVNVHFFLAELFPFFEESLSPGGYLLFETVPGHAGNYVELPKAGQLKGLLGKAFEIEHYKEAKVGPTDYDAVTVRLLASHNGVTGPNARCVGYASSSGGTTAQSHKRKGTGQ